MLAKNCKVAKLASCVLGMYYMIGVGITNNFLLRGSEGFDLNPHFTLFYFFTFTNNGSRNVEV